MKKFHVYGIGNALLDLDFEVTAESLTRLKIDKGVMTLIDEDRHHYLLEELDGIKHVKASGGSAANTLYTLQQLGAKTYYSCKIGNDEAGDYFHRDLVMQGIETNIHELPREGVTGKCIVLVTPDADRTMNTYLGATAKFSKAQLSEAALSQAEYLYIEGYLVASPTGCEAAIAARHMADTHHTKVALSLSDPNMVTYFSDGLRTIIGNKVDLIFCNYDEARLFTSSQTLDETVERLKNYAKTFVITLGAKGALIYDGHHAHIMPAHPATVVDRVGAGDVFAGAFFYGITHGLSYLQAGELANFASAKVVAKFGPRLTQDEMQEVKTRLPEGYLKVVE